VAVFLGWGVGAGAWPAWWLVATLAVADLLALRFPLHISVSVKVSVAASVWFATALLMPALKAAALVGAIMAVNVALSAFRRARATREKPPVGTVASSLLFNAGQSIFRCWSPAWCCPRLGPPRMPR